MTPWTSLSGWQAPGRPCRRPLEDSPMLIRPQRESPISRIQHISLKNCRMCSSTRRVFRLCLLILVAVSSVSSAPINPAHQHGTISQEADSISLSSSSSSSTLEHLPHPHGSRHSETLEEEEEEQSLLREERALRSSSRWPNATIPFAFNTNSLSLVQRNRIIKAMRVWQKKTCIRFVERTREQYFVNIYRNDAACQSRVGYQPFRVFRDKGQPMQLSQTYCLEAKDRGKIVHELGHAIGFYHEQQRPDRNEYVEILWDNMIDSQDIRRDYEIRSDAHSIGTKYDYKSIMHYSPLANSANGNATMIIKDERYTNIVGHRNQPSSTDYRQANLFYSCTDDDTVMEYYMHRPDLLPTSANIIRSGDSITLTPEVVSNRTWWLNCTNDCELSDRAGKKFNSDDVTDCTELIFEMQKINEGHLYIRVGDTVTLKQRSSMGINIVACPDNGKECRAKKDCVTGGGGGGGKFDESLMCREDVFIVGALGKSEGELISHRDSITFSIPTTNVQLVKSLFKCRVNEGDLDGQCYRIDCPLNFVGPDDSDMLDECNQPSTFLVTKL